MDRITSSVLTTWVQEQVIHFKSPTYQANGRGLAKRCNLNNELNLLKTIFNWYINSESFEKEAIGLKCPVQLPHKRKGFIKPVPVKERAITLDHALLFFKQLQPLYRDLAMLQFFTASRISEAAGLQWNRVDFKNRKIVIMETCNWHPVHKTFVKLNETPKNKQPRKIHMTNELFQILSRRFSNKEDKNNFVFHDHGRPLGYGTIQLNYRKAQLDAQVPYTGTHILRHGMATLARKVGGGLDAVIAMTGHKDFKLANHYSNLDTDYQKDVSEKIMLAIRERQGAHDDLGNIIQLAQYANAK
jgi:integrase